MSEEKKGVSMGIKEKSWGKEGTYEGYLCQRRKRTGVVKEKRRCPNYLG